MYSTYFHEIDKHAAAVLGAVVLQHGAVRECVDHIRAAIINRKVVRVTGVQLSSVHK